MPLYGKNCQPYFVQSDVARTSGFASYCLAISKVFNGEVSDAAVAAQKAADVLATAIRNIHAAEKADKQHRKEEREAKAKA